MSIGNIAKIGICTAALLLVPAAAAADPGIRIGEDSIQVTLEAGDYRLVQKDGFTRIVMDGFEALAVPGCPALPAKRFLLALPPGTRPVTLEVGEVASRALPGSYDIPPTPAVRPASGSPRFRDAVRRMEREWEAAYESSYGRGDPYPAEIVRRVGSGTLRKYAYVSVAFYPFTYHPGSGKLTAHESARIEIGFERDDESCPGGVLPETLLMDRAADGRAAALFMNYEEIAPLYAPPPGRAPTSTYDYVILTTAALSPTVDATSFPSWKTALGFCVRTVLTSDALITGQPGADQAERIRNFLRSHYNAWGIRYLLIVGDYATVPMRICYPDPSYHVYNPNDPGLVAPGTPTDHYYADLSYSDAASWDSDGDGYLGEYGHDDPDFLAEISVGRIPVDDPARITYSLEKLVAFEMDTGAWKNNVLHAGSILFFENQNHGGGPFVDGSTALAAMETDFMAGRTITHLTEREGLVPSLFTWPAISETSFTDAWGNGEHAIVNWSGHGWPDSANRTIWSWDDGDGVPEHGNGELTGYRFIGHGSANVDDDHPSILFAISCDVGFPEPNPYGNLGIDLLTLPGWGPSAGVVSAARPAAVSGDFTNDPGGTESICYEFNRYMIEQGERVGDALYDGKFYATTNYGWDRVYEYMNLYNFNLYGDPALEVAGGAPSPLTLMLAKSPEASYKTILDWSGGWASAWTLERSDTPDFATCVTVYDGPLRSAMDSATANPVVYYRVHGD